MHPGIKSVTTIHRTTCRANGIRQFYLEAGAGPPVILLHGFPETSFAWRFQIPALAPYYRVIAPDLRGYGETDKPSEGYDKRTMANDIVELLKTLGVGRVALVGHDRGARVATRLVKDHPDLVDRLVVMRQPYWLPCSKYAGGHRAKIQSSNYGSSQAARV